MHCCDSVLRCKKYIHIYQLVILTSMHVSVYENNSVFYDLVSITNTNELNLKLQVITTFKSIHFQGPVVHI